MKESSRRKLLQNRIYRIYRRVRYLRYLKKLRKIKKRQAKIEKKLEKKSFRKSLRSQSLSTKAFEKQKIKSDKIAFAEENRRIKKEIKQKMKLERELEKKKAQAEKETKKIEKQDVREALKEKFKQDKQVEIQKRREIKEKRRLYNQKKRQLRPYLIKRRYREFFYSLRSINRKSIGSWFSWFGEMMLNNRERGNFVRIFFNSILLFIISYELIYIIGQIITAWVATTFDYRIILFSYKIFYNIDSDQWTPDSVRILYSIIPFTGLILGTVCIIIYSNMRNNTGVYKLFYLWGFVHGMVLFFGSTLMGALLNQGFGWVLAYMYYRDTGKMVFTIIAIFALVSIGSAAAKSFLISGNSYLNYVDRNNRRLLFFAQVLLPGIIGTVIIGLLKIPPDPYFMAMDEYMFEISKIGTILILLIPMALTFKSFGETYFDEAPRKIRFRWLYLLFALIIIVVQIGLLGEGLHIEPGE